MGKFNFGLSSDAADSNLDSFYTGDVPPVGVYRCRVKQVKATLNKNGDGMLKILLEIEEPEKSPKAEFNGYAMWPNLNVTDQGAPWLNNFLTACGADPKKFAAGDVTISGKAPTKEKPEDVLKVGTKSLVGSLVMVNAKADSWNDQDRLVADRYLLDDLPATKGSKSAPVEDEGDEAEGLSDPEDETGEDETAAEETAEEGDGESYTEEELGELAPTDLKGICDEWEIAYAAKATKSTLIKAILKFQEEAAAASAEEETEGEDETGEEPEESEGDEAELWTEEELEAITDKDELLEIITGAGWTPPKKKIPSLLRAFILKSQAEPPF